MKTSIKAICILVSIGLPLLCSAATDYTKHNEKEDVVPLAKLNPNFNTGIGQGATVDTGIILSNDGKVWLWGFKGSGQGGNGKHYEPDMPPKPVASLNNIVRVTGGIYHILALDSNGDLWGWGQSGYGETGCPGAYPNIPCKVLSNIVYMDAGEYWSIALDKDGNVYTWGHNLYGQIGNGKRKNSRVPFHLNSRLGGEKAVLVGAAYEHGYAVTVSNGKYKVWGWGDNEGRALGVVRPCLGQHIIRNPVHIKQLDKYAKDIVYIAGGNAWGTALLKNGDVIGWGRLASLGQGVAKLNECTDVPIHILNNVERLYSRYVGSIALTNRGEIFTWGQTAGSAFKMIYGYSVTHRANVIGTPVAIGGGKEHIYYSNSNGEMYGVGYNPRGQTNPNERGKIQDWPGGRIPVQEWLTK